MRKALLLLFVLASLTAGFLASPSGKAAASGCVTFCSQPDPCGYVCCYKQCCGRLCVILDCAPPPPCGETN